MTTGNNENFNGHIHSSDGNESFLFYLYLFSLISVSTTIVWPDWTMLVSRMVSYKKQELFTFHYHLFLIFVFVLCFVPSIYCVLWLFMPSIYCVLWLFMPSISCVLWLFMPSISCVLRLFMPSVFSKVYFSVEIQKCTENSV